METKRRLEPGTVVVAVALAAWIIVGLASPWADLSEDQSTAVIATLMAWGWVSWTAVAIALLVPSPISATIVHVVTPWAVLCAAIDVDPVALFGSLVAMITVRSSVLVDRMVQGGAYGREVRHALRTPWPQVAPAVVAWATWSGALIGGTLALARGQWWIGVPVTAVGLVLSRTVPRRLHQLFRRWLVVVPAGLVIHDHLVLAETIMAPRARVKSVRVTDTSGDNADFTGGVPGSRLAIELTQPDKVVLSPMTAKLLGVNEVLHVTTYEVAPRRVTAAARHFMT